MALARILKNYEMIRQWQFIQKTSAHYVLKLAVNCKSGLEETSSDEILTQLKRLLGDDSDISIEYVDDIPVLNSGKRKSVVNLWKNCHC